MIQIFVLNVTDPVTSSLIANLSQTETSESSEKMQNTKGKIRILMGREAPQKILNIHLKGWVIYIPIRSM